MKNNILVFLGFLVICLVNLSAEHRKNHVKPPAPPPPKIDVNDQIDAQSASDPLPENLSHRHPG